MSKELDELIANLHTCDLKMAAFDFAKRLGGGAYPREMQQALELFTKVPCPETAVILIQAYPEAGGIVALSNGRFAHSLPSELRGAHYDGLDRWMQSFEQNLRASDAIHAFLLDGALNGTVSIGFHRMRDQHVLFHRLATIGTRKSLFRNGRQFLRDKITHNRSAFRAVLDLVCVHGIHDGRERFWNALGAELDAKWHLESEMQYDLLMNAAVFAELLSDVTSRTGQ